MAQIVAQIAHAETTPLSVTIVEQPAQREFNEVTNQTARNTVAGNQRERQINGMRIFRRTQRVAQVLIQDQVKRIVKTKIIKKSSKIIAKQTFQVMVEKGAKQALQKGAIQAGKQIGTELLQKGSKQAAQSFTSKCIPFVGCAISVGFALNQCRNGNYWYATGQLASGICSMFPGVGTAASLAIDGVMIGFKVNQALNED